MPRIIAVFALMAAFLVTVAGAAHACSCRDLPPKERVRDSAAVFTATATAVRVDEEMLGGGKVTATLRADHVYKGDPGAEFEVVTRAQGAACGYEFAEGERYLLFARAADSGLTTSLCSGNRRLPPGDSPLSLSDETYGMGELTAELITALGTPRAPRPAAAEPGPSGGGPIVPAVLALAGVALMVAVAWALRRSRKAG